MELGQLQKVLENFKNQINFIETSVSNGDYVLAALESLMDHIQAIFIAGRQPDNTFTTRAFMDIIRTEFTPNAHIAVEPLQKLGYTPLTEEESNLFITNPSTNALWVEQGVPNDDTTPAVIAVSITDFLNNTNEISDRMTEILRSYARLLTQVGDNDDAALGGDANARRGSAVKYLLDMFSIIIPALKGSFEHMKTIVPVAGLNWNAANALFDGGGDIEVTVVGANADVVPYINSNIKYNLIPFIEQLCSIATYTDLVKLDITTGQTKTIVLDFSDMLQVVEGSFNNIKIAIGKFRMLLDKQYIQKFEMVKLKYKNYLVNNDLSLYNLEDALVEKLLKGRRYVDDELEEKREESLNRLNNSIHKIMNAIKLTDGNDAHLGNEISSLCYWDNNNFGEANSLANRIAERNDGQFPFYIIPHAELPDGSRTKALDALEVKLSMSNTGDDNGVAVPPLAAPADVAEYKSAMTSLNGQGGFFIRSRRPWYNTDPNSPGFFRSRYFGMGLLMQFNQIIAKYVQQFYDGGTRSFYSSLIEDFANGQNSSAVMEGKAIDDISTSSGPAAANTRGDQVIPPNIGATNTWTPGDPQSGVILYATIARAMKILLVRQTFDGKPFYRVDSLSELQPYYVDNLKTNLPGFIKLFEIIQDRACLLRMLILDTDIKSKLERPVPVDGNSENYRGLFVGYKDTLNGVTVRQNYLANMIDNIRSSANAIKNCALKVYKELNDTPLFMEVRNGFFDSYRKTTGEYPLTLLSNMQVGEFNPGSCVDDMKMFNTANYIVIAGIPMMGAIDKLQLAAPKSNNCVSNTPLLPLYKGSNPYAKYNRGIRGSINGDKYTLDYFPGFKYFVDQYNGGVSGSSRFDNSLLSSLINNQITIAKYLTDIKHFKSQFVVSTYQSLIDVGLDYPEYEFKHDLLGSFDNNTDNVALEADDLLGKNKELTANAYFESYIRYSIKDNRRDFDKLLFLIENQDCGEGKRVLIDFYKDGYKGLKKLEDTTETRKDSRFLNLIDLDIVPINIHALEREVPLINVLNYSYSFDQMLIEILNARVARTVDNAVGPVGCYLIAPDAQNLVGAENDPTTANNNIIPFGAVNSVNRYRSENTLTTTLANPYMDLSFIDWFTYVGRIMTGAMGIEGFERPKYLSDQIWNKAVFMEYGPIESSDWSKPDPAGPIVSWSTGMYNDQQRTFRQSIQLWYEDPQSAAAGAAAAGGAVNAVLLERWNTLVGNVPLSNVAGLNVPARFANNGDHAQQGAALHALYAAIAVLHGGDFNQITSEELLLELSDRVNGSINILDPKRNNNLLIDQIYEWWYTYCILSLSSYLFGIFKSSVVAVAAPVANASMAGRNAVLVVTGVNAASNAATANNAPVAAPNPPIVDVNELANSYALAFIITTLAEAPANAAAPTIVEARSISNLAMDQHNPLAYMISIIDAAQAVNAAGFIVAHDGAGALVDQATMQMQRADTDLWEMHVPTIPIPEPAANQVRDVINALTPGAPVAPLGIAGNVATVAEITSGAVIPALIANHFDILNVLLTNNIYSYTHGYGQYYGDPFPAGRNPYDRFENSPLTYYEKGGSLDNNRWAGKGANTTMKQVPVNNALTKRILQMKYGKQRFDTKLIRNVTWFTQLHRVVRWYLTQALRGRPHPLVYNEEVANIDNTEYFNNQVYNINQYEPFWADREI